MNDFVSILMNALMVTDGYKSSHREQYPKNTTLVYSNFTPRALRHAPDGIDKVVSFGQQMVIRQIHELYEIGFFKRDKAEVCGEIKRELSLYLGVDYDVAHFEVLHDLGYLPIHVKSMAEGLKIPIKIPMLTVVNTKDEFFWLTNYLETIISNLLWKPMTSATIADHYRTLLHKWQLMTDKDAPTGVDFQAHDFSMRGMDSIDATISSGLGHIISFLGTDSLPVIFGARKYYDAEGFVAASVPATEHSVMCAGGKEDEIDTFRRLMATYPKGILSIVSDTWDLWTVLTKYLPLLKDEIMARDGKIVIRPDSGNPVDIICGEAVRVKHYTQIPDHFSKIYFAEDTQKYYKCESKYHREWETVEVDPTPQDKGVINILWEIFGGTTNSQGFKVLDPHIGAIYGDAITMDRAQQICEKLADMGFATTNIVLGIGSFTYQHNTRDTFGFAMKATYVELQTFTNPTGDNVDAEIVTEGREIFKDPITDRGVKKSAKGLLQVIKGPNGYELRDGVTWEDEAKGELKTIYIDGKFQNQTSLNKIRETIKIK